MSASVATNLKSLLNQSSASGSPADLSWRVLALVNLFRLLVVLLLFVLFMSVTPTSVGRTAPAVFIGTIVAYLLYTAISISSVKRRWPDLSLQTFVNVCADVLAISFFTYSSGGMNSFSWWLPALGGATQFFNIENPRHAYSLIRNQAHA